MTRIIRVLMIVCICMGTHWLYGQQLPVQLQASVSMTPPQIRLSWKPLSILPACTDTSWICIARKAKEDIHWDTLTRIHIVDTTWTDFSVIPGQAYEYYVFSIRVPVPDCGIITPVCTECVVSAGYIYAGLEVAPVHSRGTLLLVADDVFIDSCAMEIQQLMEDINGDGWRVVRRDVSRTLRDTAIRSIIHDAYTEYDDIASVLLLGHIAVPYSGQVAPDGHTNHIGAWPADIYYGDAYRAGGNDTAWTDTLINTTVATSPRNHNVPGDGKWDQIRVFTPIAKTRLQISRIDFYDMPAFGKTEIELMRSYLRRNHNYKMDLLDVRRRALIDNNFSGANYVNTAWRNFAPLTGVDQIYEVDFISSLNDSSFQWAYGCGPGTFTSAGGIGTTNDIAAGAMNGIFTMLFGSYFGDWDSRNNFLRAPLCASPPALTSCWAADRGGVDDWYLHHMALGEPIGYSVLLNHSASPSYYSHSSLGQSIHLALMGDLTLRTDYIKPPAGLQLATHPFGIQVGWDAAPDSAVAGYYVYRSDSRFGKYHRVSELVTSTIYYDQASGRGIKYYMVRPVKLEHTPSGTYYNLGIGIKDSIDIGMLRPGKALPVAPVETGRDLQLYPNPVSHSLYITVEADDASDAIIEVTDLKGQIVILTEQRLHAGSNTLSIDVRSLPPAAYILHVHRGDRTFTGKFFRMNGLSD